MKAIKVNIKDAEEVKQDLIKNGLLNKDYKPKKGDGFVWFPVLGDFSDYESHDVNLVRSEYRINFKDAVKEILSDEEIKLIKTSYDVVGDIAIVEIDEDLRSKEKKIGNLLLKINKSINTVLRKSGSHGGTFRTQDMVFLAGEDKRETVHVESGLKFLVDVEKVYFSPRLSSERKRIVDLVKPGEKVLVMFSGCGIYPLLISDGSEAAEILGVEINPEGHNYALKNAELNKISNVKFICGDVSEVLPDLEDKFDRIIMPLPRDAYKFLNLVKFVGKKGCKVHMYAFEGEPFDDFWEEVEKHFKAIKRLDLVKCCQIAPRKHRISLDFEVIEF